MYLVWSKVDFQPTGQILLLWSLIMKTVNRNVLKSKGWVSKTVGMRLKGGGGVVTVHRKSL